jgi:hypothetical protein
MRLGDIGLHKNITHYSHRDYGIHSGSGLVQTKPHKAAAAQSRLA